MAGIEKRIDPDTYLADKFIALHAHEYWLQRGCPLDSAETDWYKAIDDIRREMTVASGMTDTEMALCHRQRR